MQHQVKIILFLTGFLLFPSLVGASGPFWSIRAEGIIRKIEPKKRKRVPVEVELIGKLPKLCGKLLESHLVRAVILSKKYHPVLGDRIKLRNRCGKGGLTPTGPPPCRCDGWGFRGVVRER